ncbi:MAG: tRNA guanosine(34) transglycosylase Tgt [Candidatus Absconditabacterales bacterium]|nr:tRNA guanosine(34) transglycosylase Tgt [Candidatus Absconditabacterales bacterium]
MSKLSFTIHATQGKARAGTIRLNGVEVPTPVFMPVGTKATIKGLILDMLRDPQYIGDLPTINLILANTYHLYLRPGTETVKQAGGLHTFERRPGLILTDSGGFQVFSLGLGKSDASSIAGKNRNRGQSNTSLCKILPEGVKFRSIHDGSRHFFSPAGCVDVQCALGSDIMMMLDVCSPPSCSDRTFAQHLILTHQWAREQFEHHQKKYTDCRGVLFPIVQGGTNLDLRKHSIEVLSPFAPDGIAVGGVSVGEPVHEIQKVVSFCGEHLPEDKPRYLMGVGNPEGIRYAIEQGFDMFDCVLPTRLGRHGVFFSDDGYQKISNACFKNDHTPLAPQYSWLPAQYTKAYLHHLWREKEMLGGILLSLHNICYLHQMVTQIRKEIVG